jgi:hypothetical protein
MKPYHFYLAFNPLFNTPGKWKTQAHEFYYKLKGMKQSDPSASLYWGKIQISRFSKPLHLPDYEKVIQENDELQMSTHLYITDYHHLWVGKVKKVTTEKVEPAQTLEFYQNKDVEMWFELVDFDLLCNSASDTQKYLSDIHVDNEFYPFKIQAMTPFVSHIRFPMIVQDRHQLRYFGQNQIEAWRVNQNNPLLESHGELLDLSQVSSGFVIPEACFRYLPEEIKGQIINAEILLLEAQAGDRKDRLKLEQAILTYLKCLELLLNETLVAYLKKYEGHRIWVTKDQASPKFIRTALDKDKSSLIRLRDATGIFQLSQIKMLLDTPAFFSHTTLDHVFKNKLPFWEYCRLELRPTLKNEGLIELRTQLEQPHTSQTQDRELLLIRNILLGVGGKGVFSEIIDSWFDRKIKSSKAA